MARSLPEDTTKVNLKFSSAVRGDGAWMLPCLCMHTECQIILVPQNTTVFCDLCWFCTIWLSGGNHTSLVEVLFRSFGVVVGSGCRLV